MASVAFTFIFRPVFSAASESFVDIDCSCCCFMSSAKSRSSIVYWRSTNFLTTEGPCLFDWLLLFSSCSSQWPSRNLLETTVLSHTSLQMGLLTFHSAIQWTAQWWCARWWCGLCTLCPFETLLALVSVACPRPPLVSPRWFWSGPCKRQFRAQFLPNCHIAKRSCIVR